MRSLGALSLVLVIVSACGGGTKDPPMPIVSANGMISIGGHNLALAYGVAGSDNSGAIHVILSDVPTRCSMLIDEWHYENPPDAGNYMIATRPYYWGSNGWKYVGFMKISQDGHIDDDGSETDKIEAPDITDSTVTIRVDYRESLSLGECVTSGEFKITRCPETVP